MVGHREPTPPTVPSLLLALKPVQLVAIVRTLRLQLSFNLGVGPVVNERIVGRFFIVAIGRL